MRLAFCFCLATASATHAQLGPCTIETVVGDPTVVRGDGGPALQAELLRPSEARFGPDGYVYIADNGHRRFRRVSPEGLIETFAGNGTDEITGDGGPASQAGIREIRTFTFAPDGSLYFVDHTRLHQVVRRIDPSGVITSVAGPGAPHVDGSEEFVPAVNQFRIAAGPDGSAYLAVRNRIYRIDPEGKISHFAGMERMINDGGSVSGDGGPATEALIQDISDIVVDSQGVVYFIDDRSSRIRSIDLDGMIDTFLAFRSSDRSSSLEIDRLDRLYWANSASGVRRLGLDGRVDTVWEGAFVGRGFHVSPDGRLLRTRNHQILELGPRSSVSVLAGLGPTAPRGDGGPARSATLDRVTGLAVGRRGELYIADAGLRRVRVVRNGRIEPFAGTGRMGFAGDRGPALDAEFISADGVAVGPDGSVYAPDRHRVRRIDASGRISTFAGTGEDRCSTVGLDGVNCGDGGPAIQAETPSIRQIAATPDGSIYLVSFDRGRNEFSWVRKVDSDGVISTLPRSSSRSTSAVSIGAHPDGLLVVDAPLASIFHADGSSRPVAGFVNFFNFSRALVGDSQGNVYLAQSFEGLRRLTPFGILNTIVEHRRGERSLRGDRGPAGDALMGEYALAMAVDRADNLYFTDSDHARIRRINRASSCAAVASPSVRRLGYFSATFASLALAPGSLFTASGRRLGPVAGVGARLGSDGRLTTELAGVRVLVDGVEAPLLFVSASQINGVIPHGSIVGGRLIPRVGSTSFLTERYSRVVIERDGVRSDATYLTIWPTAPALFRQLPTNFAAALNQDGSVNGPESPAAPGSVVALFGSGAGVMDPPGVDGAISAPPLPRPAAPVHVEFGGEQAEVLYAGAAPGLVTGVIQINARISPEQRQRGEVEVSVRIGGVRTLQGSTVLAIEREE